MLQLIQLSKEELLEEFEVMVRRVFEKMMTEKKADEEKELYTREEAAKLLNVSYPTLFHWNKDGKLKARKIGKRVYYSKEDVKEALNKLNN
ncbi:helix-turn-helix domain-containing protein [Elizabethkingia ursingii]|uniref:helix-turn-helix domain-containing protein n=1 Tax=Elizabethkingia ursingii TaxID=1756150 RepID=UPI0020118B91|nr:helix-turn-helix domain-containing protein [Elizabethkingia ursingii]MCL1671463.1 helix-turn-helix domain-containing protein [Elizabethkingia ursingii]